MKLISAIVRPHCLEDLRLAFARMGVDGLTVNETELHGAEQARTEVYRGAEYRVDWEPRMRVEIAVDDGVAEQVAEALCNIARSARYDDGQVLVSGLVEAIRIRTGEHGPFAI